MKYDFKTVVDRSSCGASKWDMMKTARDRITANTDSCNNKSSISKTEADSNDSSGKNLNSVESKKKCAENDIDTKICETTNKTTCINTREPIIETACEIVPFSVADMEFKVAPPIIEGLKRVLDTQILGYTQPTDGYFSAICSWMKSQHDWDIDPADIVFSPGIVPALYHAVATYCNPQEGVIIMPPVYYPFYSAIETNDCVVVRCPLINQNGYYTMDFELLELVASDPKNKLLIFCSPHNPVGRVWSRTELEQVAEICKKHDVLVISDEIHADIIMPEQKHIPFSQIPGFENDAIVCTAPSKTFNLATMQVSNLVIPNEKLRKQLTDTQARYAIHPNNLLGFEACRIAYTECSDWMHEMLEVVWNNYQFVNTYLAKHLPQITVSPLQGTYLLWLDCREICNDKDILEQSMVANELFFDEGYVFGDEGIGFERINLACPHDLVVNAMKRFDTAISALL